MPNSRRKFFSTLAVALVALGLVAAQVHAKPTSHCQIVTPKTVSITAGQKSEFFVGLVPNDGFAVSTAGPLRISLLPEPGAGISLKRSELVRRDAVNPASASPRFSVRAEGATAGRFRVEVSAHFWLCKAGLCRPQSVQASFAVYVEASAPVTPASPDIK